MTAMVVAGRVVPDPVARAAQYAVAHPGTVARFDLAGPGDPDVLTGVEVARTRVVSSRISAREAAWFTAWATSAPWSHVPAGARLVDADPVEADGLYEAGTALYDHFRRAAPPGVSVAKVSKVLHVKRPHLVPILDSRLLSAYRPAAAAAAARYRPGRPGGRLFWAAIRDDLLAHADALAGVRTALAGHHDAQVCALAQVSDLRLLDILAW